MYLIHLYLISPMRKSYNMQRVLVFHFYYYHYQKFHFRASLVAQWLRIHLPMQGTRVRALAWEDPTCHGATKPVHHNY